MMAKRRTGDWKTRVDAEIRANPKGLDLAVVVMLLKEKACMRRLCMQASER